MVRRDESETAVARAPRSAHPLCERYGFGRAGRARRLALIGLDPRDEGLLERLRTEVIAPAADAIVGAFYEHLKGQEAFDRVLGKGFAIDGLRQALKGYLLGLGEGFAGADYFEGRLRIGLVHARVGVPPAVYQAAQRVLAQAIIDRLPRAGALAPRREELADLVLRITTLDTTLAIETYHLQKIESLERSLEQTRDAERELRVRATTDALTGLPNRPRILAELDLAIEKARAERAPLCVVMADLDHFKRVNDHHGHLVGDDMLREVAHRMQAALRQSDLIGRYGGEEFLLILREASREVAVGVAERVRKRVGAEPFRIGGLRLPMTVSQGVAQLRADEAAAALIARADSALYAAKDAGRDRVELHEA